MPRRIEQKYTSEFLSELFHFGCYVYKLPDFFVDPHSSRFTPPRPFDGICVSHGRCAAFEFKAHVTHRAFNIDLVRDHQINALRDFSSVGGGSSFLGIFAAFNAPKLRGGFPPIEDGGYLRDFVTGGGNICVLYLIDIFDWIREEDSLSEKGRSSIPMEDLNSIASFRIGKRHGKWDVEEFVRYLGGDLNSEN